MQLFQIGCDFHTRCVVHSLSLIDRILAQLGGALVLTLRRGLAAAEAHGKSSDWPPVKNPCRFTRIVLILPV